MLRTRKEEIGHTEEVRGERNDTESERGINRWGGDSRCVHAHL